MPLDHSTRAHSFHTPYDFNGNLIEDAEGRKFSFNGDNKQTEVRDSNNNLVGQYFYDAEGKRVKKISQTDSTIFVYDGAGKLIAEYSINGTLPSNPQTSYVVTDTLQSVRAISNQNGEVVSRRDFMPFGEELYAGTPNRTEGLKYSPAGSDNLRKQFTGYEKDTETGLDFAEARYYNNRHGRFTAVDPLLASGKSADPQTFNRYSYVMNSPLKFTDPSGMQAGNYTGTVYYNKNTDEFSNKEGDGFVEYTGPIFISDRNDGYRYRISGSGWLQLGKTDDIIHREKFWSSIVNKINDSATWMGEVLSQAPLMMGEALAQAPGVEGTIDELTPKWVNSIRGPDAITANWTVLAQGQTYTWDAYGNSYSSDWDFSPRVFFTRNGGIAPLEKFRSSSSITPLKSTINFIGVGFSVNATWAWTKKAPSNRQSIEIFEGSDFGANYYHSIRGLPIGPGGGITVNPGIKRNEDTIIQTNLGIGLTGFGGGVSRDSRIVSRGGWWAWRKIQSP